MSMLLSGCSNNSENHSISKKQKLKKEITTNFSKGPAKTLQHVHPSNPCTAGLTHSHPYQAKDHQHSYDCENTNEFVNNAHIHPATKVTRKFRHVHPNGSSKHFHHKQ